MAKTVIRAHMKQRRDTAVNWQAQNPVLLDGEIGIVTDQPDRYKVGDGVTAWNALPLRGFDGNIVQTTGTSRTAVMSQAAVSQSLEYLEDHTVTPEQLAETVAVLATKDELSEKQDTLISGKNIKTLNGESLLGSGNIELDLSEYAKQADLETLTAEVIANEEVTAAALNDLNDKIAEVEAGAQTITIDAELSDSSENPVQNKAVTNELNKKQDTLESGTSIKTINGESLLGSGNLVVVTDLSECATKAEVAVVSETVTANKTAADNAVSALSEIVTTNKTAADDAISALDTRVGEAEASLALCATKTEVETLTTEVIANEQVTAAALNDLNDKIAEIIARLDALSA